MPLDVLGRTRATLSDSASLNLNRKVWVIFQSPTCWGLMIVIIHHERGIPSKRESSARVDYVPALCTHRPSLVPIEWLSETSGLAYHWWQHHRFAEKLVKLGHLEELKVVTR